MDIWYSHHDLPWVGRLFHVLCFLGLQLLEDNATLNLVPLALPFWGQPRRVVDIQEFLSHGRTLVVIEAWRIAENRYSFRRFAFLSSVVLRFLPFERLIIAHRVPHLVKHAAPWKQVKILLYVQRNFLKFLLHVDNFLLGDHLDVFAHLLHLYHLNNEKS